MKSPCDVFKSLIPLGNLYVLLISVGLQSLEMHVFFAYMQHYLKYLVK